MIDGDENLYSKDPKVAQEFMATVDSIYKLRDGQAVDAAKKKRITDHYNSMGARANEIAAAGDNVVVSFIAPLAWTRDLVRKAVPDVLMVKIHVEVPVLIERNFKRLQTACEQMGTTLEEAYYGDEPDSVRIREKYGPTYSDELYKRWIKDEWYACYDEEKAHEAPYTQTIQNTEYSINGLKQLRDFLGLKGAFEYKPEELIQK